MTREMSPQSRSRTGHVNSGVSGVYIKVLQVSVELSPANINCQKQYHKNGSAEDFLRSVSVLLALFDAVAQLEQAVEGEGGDVGPSPPLRVLLHVLLKLDPARLLPPLKLAGVRHAQLLQLHKQLQHTERSCS